MISATGADSNVVDSNATEENVADSSSCNHFGGKAREPV